VSPWPALVLDLGDVTEVDGLAQEWLELLSRASTSSYFQTPDWVLSWWEHLAGRPLTRLAVWRGAAGELQGLAAMSRITERLHPTLPVRATVWVNSGSGPGAGDHLGWPATPQMLPEMFRWAASLPGTVILRNLHSELARGMSAGAGAVTPTFRVALPVAGEVVGGSSDFRKKLRWSERKLAELDFRLLAGGELGRGVVEGLIGLHQRRSLDMGWNSSFSLDRIDFHLGLIARGGDGRGPAAMTAWLGERLVGGIYGFLWGDTFAYYQTGWEPEYSAYSLGSVLIASAMRALRDRGVTVFDFLRGDDTYKRRFGAVMMADHTLMVPKGLGGRLLQLKGRMRSA
jgi:CelD/BcsL family acetyltransferase involved in cellulose biosynthesis